MINISSLKDTAFNKRFSTHSTISIDQLSSGSGYFNFIDWQGNPNKPIVVWYYLPEKITENSPIVFVLHGLERNGKEYRDVWIKHAQNHQFILLVPEFSQKYYPKNRHYQQGNMFRRSGKPIKQTKWTFTTIERIFESVIAANNLKTKKYTIYGHSAGAQFVHRFVMFNHQARFDKALAANAGWYTMPDLNKDFPYGLGNVNFEKEDLEKIFSQKLFILLGTEDTDPHHPHLRQTPEVKAQGKNRLIRGKTFYEAAKTIAIEENLKFCWELKEIEGAGHNDLEMSESAVKLMF